ncbi:MAG: N-6 DNA methylase [Luteitalea sp.]|nr:N-6 DNA methylase [Luteitalea sp.]
MARTSRPQSARARSNPHQPSSSFFFWSPDVLPGYRGHLVSESFLEQQIGSTSGPGRNKILSPPGFGAWRGIRRGLGPASALRAVLETGAVPLLRHLGFDDVSRVCAHDQALFATARGQGAIVGLLVAAWGVRLDRYWRPAVVEARRLGIEWCVLFNGTHLRVVNCGRVHSRRYAEFDLEIALDQDRSAAALLAVAGAQALATVAPHGTTSTGTLMRRSDAQAAAVCGALRIGVLDASQTVLAALLWWDWSIPAIEAAFEQALTLVYRILFLLFAEARALVPLWHPVYRESYSLEGLLDAATGGTASGLWDGLRAVNRLAYAGCRAGDLHVTPFNGRLFAPARTPLAERRNLDDEAARRALVALSTRTAADGEGRQPISYRDLGVEQLGAVYETLLDYAPHVESRTPSPHCRVPPHVTLRPGSGRRKSTGAFYTPQPLTHFLTRHSLAPLVRDASPDQILGLRILDPSVGSGAFLVAACGYLADAYETALGEWNGVHSSDIGSADRAKFRRTIAERCLYGVDVNPMAVQLARLSLWLTTLAADRPLSFLDHHVVTGDSLLGTWLGTLRRPPGRRAAALPLPLFDEAAAVVAVRGTLPVRFSLSLEPNDTPEQVRAKERALLAMSHRNTAISRWKRVADVWCAHWFSKPDDIPTAAFAALVDAILTGRCALPGPVTSAYLRATESAGANRRFFHWELEFPEAFFDRTGERLAAAGFDAVIGNPPWDMLRADPGERDSSTWSRAETADVIRFTRDSGVYVGQSTGHANRYQLFLERAIALTRPGGRIGLVMPRGLLSDHGSARLRRLLFSECGVDTLVGMDNRRRVFPIHRSVRFVLLAATRGEPTTEFGCRLGEDDPAILETAGDVAAGRDEWCTVRLSPELLERVSGHGLDVPDCKGPRDLAIVERAAALFEPLGSPGSWNARFGRELNVTDDRAHFRQAGRGLPVVEGKQLEPFRVKLGETRLRIATRDAQRLLGPRCERPRLAYRDVASATNRVTLIAAVLPSGCVSTHTVFCLRSPHPSRAQHFLCGLFNSFVLNYLVRLRVNTHVTTAIVERLPVPSVDQAGEAFKEVAALARMLAGRVDTGLTARLNAVVTEMYRLTADDFAHVLDTFPLVPEAERRAAFRAFEDRR